MTLQVVLPISQMLNLEYKEMIEDSQLFQVQMKLQLEHLLIHLGLKLKGTFITSKTS